MQKGRKKIDPEDKQKYQGEIKKIRNTLADKIGKVGKLEKSMKEDPYDLGNYYHVAIANEYLEMVDLSCGMSKVSETYLKKKNDDFLNDGRKTFFKALIELEKLFGTFVDTTLNENQEILESISKMDPKRIQNLMYKFRDRLRDITTGYGENSKYKWSFVDMESRFVSIFKNFLDYRRLSVNDPRDPYFPENTKLLHDVKLNLHDVSHRLREKYMLGTKEVTDIKSAINFQEALRKINAAMGLDDDAETCKKTVDSWKQMLEKEEKMKKERERIANRKGKAKKKKK